MDGAAKRLDLKVVNFGTQMLEIAKGEGLLENRDQIRSLPPEDQARIQRGAALSIKGLGDSIVDTHCTIKTPAGYHPGLPGPSVLLRLQPPGH